MDLDDSLDAVGPHLRSLRRDRDTTLADLSAETGISVSTLSRLESGDRKPTLELLLPLARSYGVTLDELVDAPPTGDPRIHLRPVEAHGMTMIPLTRQSGGIQAGASTTSSSPPGRPPSSTPGPHTGSEPRTTTQSSSSACSASTANGRTCGRGRRRRPDGDDQRAGGPTPGRLPAHREAARPRRGLRGTAVGGHRSPRGTRLARGCSVAGCPAGTVSSSPCAASGLRSTWHSAARSTTSC